MSGGCPTGGFRRSNLSFVAKVRLEFVFTSSRHLELFRLLLDLHVSFAHVLPRSYTNVCVSALHTVNGPLPSCSSCKHEPVVHAGSPEGGPPSVWEVGQRPWTLVRLIVRTGCALGDIFRPVGQKPPRTRADACM